MTLPTITILKKSYPKPELDRMKRKQVKKLKPVIQRMKGEDLEALWELVALLVPTLPAKDLDELDMGVCKAILEDAGVAKFSQNAEDTGIAAGESSASTSS